VTNDPKYRKLNMERLRVVALAESQPAAQTTIG